ncbi:hypothetical protein C1646_749418 [Rhizophagus diaphanus]|nr:hypothetical protein C1646_749418 [Rhizophagus diaphanus] [Rhizophagus sp. MUCL 43196]
MDLRTCKSSLSQWQQLQDTSFRLHKSKKMKQKEKQLVSLSVQNISHNTFAHNNNNNVPLRSDTSDIEAPIYYSLTNNSFYINQEHQDGENSDNNFEDDDFKNNDNDDDFENNDSNFEDNNYSENNDDDDNFENKNDDYDFESNDSNDNNFEDKNVSSIPLQNESQNSKQYDGNDKKFNFSGKAGPFFPIIPIFYYSYE